MKHVIDIKDIRAMTIHEQLAAAHGQGESKSLEFRYDIGRKRMYWDVIVHGQRETFDDLQDAVEAYNEA